MTTTRNNRRISVKVSPKVYQALSRAADLTGATLSQFLVQSAYEKAKAVIEKECCIKLTERSAKAFFKAMENPPKPNIKLLKAIKG